MDFRPPLDLRCRVCGVTTRLSDDPTVRMAELQVFCAAHNTHEEGIGVEVVLPQLHSSDAG